MYIFHAKWLNETYRLHDLEDSVNCAALQLFDQLLFDATPMVDSFPMALPFR